MKIEKTQCCHHQWIELSQVCTNAVVIFRSQFHQDIQRDDIFLTVNTCDSYRDQHRSTRSKVAVINLRSSKLSFVAGSRDVRIIDATVRIDE